MSRPGPADPRPGFASSRWIVPKVVVAGSANVDVVARVERFPSPGETLAATGLDTFPGGKGLNQAVAAARLGADVVLVATIGTDLSGDLLAGFLREERIDIGNVERDAAEPTGRALVLVAGGENEIVVAPGANALTSAERVAAVAVARADVCLAQLEIPEAAVRALLQRGTHARCTTILNAAPIRPVARETLAEARVLVVNEIEFAALGGDPSDPRATANHVRAPEQTLILTRAERGSLVVGREHVIEVEGFPVEVVDTTGAGDCFVGALAASLCAGARMRDAVRYANAAAAVSVQRAGASAMPTASDVDVFLSRYA